MRVLWVLLLLIWPGQALAGPWPREQGQHFLSMQASDGTASVWLERGLGRGRWLVLQGRVSRDGTWGGGLALHSALRDRGAVKLAWSLGLALDMPRNDLVIDLTPVPWPGKREYLIRIAPSVAAQVGLSAGMALTRPWPGWLAVDLAAELGPQVRKAKAEVTLGYRPTERWMVLMQAHLHAGHGKPGVYLAPSVVWRASGKLRLEAGLRHGVRDRRTAVKLGSWLEF